MFSGFKRGLGGLTAATLVTTLLTVSAAGAGPAAPIDRARQVDAAPAGAQKSKTVTLVTGDVVTVHDQNKILITPRSGVRFFTYRTGSSSYVIPSDAVPLLRSGTVDQRLFDVNALLEAHYDERPLSLIVSGSTVVPKSLRSAAKLPAVHGYVAKADRQKLPEYWKSLKAKGSAKSTGKIWLDGVRKPSLDTSVAQIGAPAAWQAGLDGTGVKVAVLDTGIDATHPDLVGKVSLAHNFAAEDEDSLDHVGHGTHVASTIAGSGAASGGKYRGVAPGATLLDGKVCGQWGCAYSWILAGMQWAAQSGADVVNMSLGGFDTPGIDPLEQAVNELSAQYGTLFVIAAGNDGPGENTVGSPASADAALAVAAVDRNEDLASFSSRGLRTGDYAVKPEISAPGVDIVAARSKDGFIGTPGESYTTLSGTSMATPHVAGAAAILTQKHPDWTGDQLKAALMASASPNPALGTHEQGAGRVDVARAIGQELTTSPTAVSFGLQAWPHDDDAVLTETVTYHNPASAAATLHLALESNAAAMFNLSADTLVVPAGGQASVTISADTRTGDQLGVLGGRITAIAGGTQVITPFAVEREQERYAVDFVHTDRVGSPASRYLTAVQDVHGQTGAWIFPDGDGVNQLRLPPGDYIAVSWVDMLDAAGEFESATQLLLPTLTIDGPKTVDFDARKAQGFKVSVFDKTVTGVLVDLGTEVPSEQGSQNVGILVGDFSQLYAGQLGDPVPGIMSSLNATLARRDPLGQFRSSPVVYDLVWTHEGSQMPGLVDEVTRDEVARIDATYARHATNDGVFFKSPIIPWSTSIVAGGLEGSLPARRSEFVSTNVAWASIFGELERTADGEQLVSVLASESRQYQAGSAYQEHWNEAVFGPTMPRTPRGNSYAFRRGDTLILGNGLFGDASGHFGDSIATRNGSTLWRNGEKLATSTEPGQAIFDVPAESGRYRFEAFAERDFPLSRRVEASWEFTSGHVDRFANLPLTAVGFQPTLDAFNRARSNEFMAIPVKIWQVPQSGAAPIIRLRVEVSVDDGQTWAPGNVAGFGSSWILLLQNPSDGYVSLRVAAEDAAGNKVEQTIIRAYGVR